MGIGMPGQAMLDMGTGTGTLARRFAGVGAKVIGIDRSPEMLEQARRLSADGGVKALFQSGTAEETGQIDHVFDVVTAGQCWHWFDSKSALKEVTRVLKFNGRLVICHFDWLPFNNNVVEATEKLILKHSPDWPYWGGSGIYPQWAKDMTDADYTDIESFSFDVNQLYSHEDWRGRIRASAGVGGTLSAEKVKAFDDDLNRLLHKDFDHEPLSVPHRCWAIIGSPPV